MQTPESAPHRRVITEVADEVRRTFAERKGWLVGLGFNIAIAVAYVAYTHYQPNRPDSVRIAGIATGVVAWVLADTINTNQLGADADRASASLERGRGAMRELALKNGALAVMLLPLAIVLSVGVRLALDRWRAVPHAVMLDLFVVFMWLGLGNVLSVLLPYCPISLRERWRVPRSWPRWLLCVAAPYLALLIVNELRWPVDRLAHYIFGRPDGHLLGYAFLYKIGRASWRERV